MTNFEYYIASGRMYGGWLDFLKTNNHPKQTSIKNYNKWLLEEYKEPILDDIEKEYLSNVIKPFRNRVICISKEMLGSSSAFIRIEIRNDFSICLPNFSCSTKMYANMKPHKRYTLKELGL
jgi:hypothetical protein